jgi:nicotinamide riboside transporter PnuC
MDDDRLYSFTVRTLYLVALLLNGAVLWDQTRDTDTGRKIRATLKAFRADVTGRVRAAQDLRAAESWVIWEAMNILNEGDTTDAD